MSLEQAILKEVRALPHDKQQEIYDHASSLTVRFIAILGNRSLTVAAPFRAARVSKRFLISTESRGHGLRRLRAETVKMPPFQNVRGLGAHLGISLSAEEIEEYQREMWRDFPREDI